MGRAQRRRKNYSAISILLTIILSTALTLTITAQDETGDFPCDEAQYPVECEALVAIYEATGGENWENREGWLEDADVCGWEGITCDDDGQVSKIDLVENGLEGDLPPEIGNLSNLQELILGGNKLRSLPAELGNLANLLTLDLSYNALTSLPPEIGNLSNLVSLQLNNNNFTCLPEGVAHPAANLPVCEE